MWEIIDDNGTIHSGTEEEMQQAFEIMTTVFRESYSEENDIPINSVNDLYEKWDVAFFGDLKLIQIHNTYR
tara:strand:+ start:4886 stop:5098 length:213 start_codon:yes stop_codon:yes gene_type:complete